MTASTPRHSLGLPSAVSVPLCVIAFLTPTVCFLLLIIVSGWSTPASTEGFPAVLIRMIALAGVLSPVAALLVCGTALWRSNLALGQRAGGLALMLLAMTFQVVILLVVIVSAITVAISPAQ